MFSSTFNRTYLRAISFLLPGPMLGASGAAIAADPVAETVKYSFAAVPDGNLPNKGALTLGKDRKLYGVSEQGGANHFGAIYRIASTGTEDVLYSFQGNGDGLDPAWGLTRDSSGNFYGMANPDSTNRGTVFKITPAGVFTTLHVFKSSDSANGYVVVDDAVTVGQDGYLYGVTSEGGIYGAGLFFRMATDGSGYTVLLNFSCDNQQPCNPQGGIVQGIDGNFYGLSTGYTDLHGNNGYGTVYRVTPTGVATTLHAFTVADGALESPKGTPTLDSSGNIYFFGGARTLSMTGRIYELDTANTLTTLHQFVAAEGLAGPDSSQLLFGKDGRLYGTTTNGGAYYPPDPSEGGYGTVFSLGLDGTFAVLHNFGATSNDGNNPEAGLVTAYDGSLWGTTRTGGPNGNGVAYRLSKPTVRLSVYPSTVAVGQTTKLKWSSTNTTSCAASDDWGPDSEPAAGTLTVSEAVAGTYTFTLTCSGAGSKSRSVKLTVN